VPKPPARDPAQNRRASPEAVAKRRAARTFNEVVLGPGARAPDGRTERRRRRLLEELSAGATRSGQELKPIEVLLRAQALLDLGETLASILGARTPRSPVPVTDALVDGVRKLHAAYSFAIELYPLVGVGEAALAAAGIAHARPGPAKTGVRAPSGAVRRGAA